MLFLKRNLKMIWLDSALLLNSVFISTVKKNIGSDVNFKLEGRKSSRIAVWKDVY